MQHHPNQPHQWDLRSEPDRRHHVSLLSGVYLDAGLPLHLAVLAAIADYEMFEDELLCKS